MNGYTRQDIQEDTDNKGTSINKKTDKKNKLEWKDNIRITRKRKQERKCKKGETRKGRQERKDKRGNTIKV